MVGYTTYNTSNSQDQVLWRGWVKANYTGSATTGTWEIWCGTDECDTTTTYDIGYTTCSTTVWSAWMRTDSGVRRVDLRHTPDPPREKTPEEKAELARQRAAEQEQRRIEREKWDAAEAKRKAEEAAADKRAEELLLDSLDKDQKAEYARDRTFHVRSRTGGRYRVRRAWSGHVERVNDAGRPVERFCIHPTVKVPDCDNMLLAKLMIEADEETFTKTANRTPLEVPVGAN